MADGIDGGLQEMQAPALQAPVDSTTAHPEVQQLLASDDAILPRRYLRHCGINRLLASSLIASLSTTTYMGARGRLAGHPRSLPRESARVARTIEISWNGCVP
jgi:hypothetical protein